ncbi:DNA polymerase III subunit gamma and tau [Corynebacterium sp. sy039]|uniref:DNA polymerase III subunit gamma and tau n=1 Tax=Corynebacterium sp. sy039 TaxID=2599641 RepID=UPI0011B67D36|nr:DNA polymerase III subunit gamma and tau [Corynebacterium sp. sy039]QDZ43353.1 DNA polymerase III subunit gamma and tau [Corynebacterium sp. sy039]
MALYRKYRPGSFAELIGQEQVTAPLSTALDNGRINHAYLFSGPRGCGKTSSARILARSLNCAQGPTSTPCGVCESCIALAPNGPGTLDVTELDAASHNGVDDMRELRDRAAYAPADSRYRIFIIDEAHMITNAGANALLKVVEEPPAHLIFIFATTEPEKVIPTIRSRVHHYPFRLLTPQAMREVISHAVAGEGIPVEESVYPLVIRAGGGSPRDTLSVLDQLLAGTEKDGLSYSRARMLLGATDETLIDAAVNALSGLDAAQLYGTVDKVIEAGLDPRRFAGDLLDHLRDLMLLQAVPQAVDMGLVDVPPERVAVLVEQIAHFGHADLPRLATTLNDGLSSLKGSTSPRLLLEILCAKMLLPGGVSSVQHDHGVPARPVAAAAPARTEAGSADSGAAASVATNAADTAAAPLKYERKSVRLAREKAEREAQAAAAQLANPPAQQESAAPADVVDERAHSRGEKEQSEPKQPEQQAQQAQQEQSKGQEQHKQQHEFNFAQLKEKWEQIRAQVHKENTATGILLLGARPNHFDSAENTIVFMHSTGALAHRLNNDPHNGIIKNVLNQEFGHELNAHYVVGNVATPQEPTVWNPEKTEDTAESESEPEPEPETAATAKVAETAAQEPQEPVAEETDGWGEPARIGQAITDDEPQKPVAPPITPAQVSAPTPATPAPEPPRRRRRWERAEQLAQEQQKNSFSDGAPLPEAPEPEWADSEPQAQKASGAEPQHIVDSSIAEEEEMMMSQAREPGNFDHRDAMTVAVELLEQELGARRL